MSKASVGAKVGTLIVGAIKGKKSAAATATAYAKAKASKAAVKAIPKTKLAEPSKASVKVLPRKTAPKTDLSGRGAKLTPKEKAKRASDLNFGKMEQSFDRSNEMRSTGLVSSRKGLVAARGAGKKNQRKADAIRKEATKENFYERIRNPIKINTNPTKPKGVFGPLKKKLAAADTPANRAKAVNNARGLKAANKPVSKNNRDRLGDGEMPAYLKSTKPARANRTRLGNTANKKGK